jgi:hypothetical protein
MKRSITLGLTLCLLGLVSGCCCGGMQGCGFRRFGGCSPCGAACAPVAPLGGCNSCGTGGFIGGGFGAAPPVYGGQPGAFVQPYQFGMATSPEGMPVETASTPYMNGIPAAMAPAGSPSMSTALAKPDSLATY